MQFSSKQNSVTGKRIQVVDLVRAIAILTTLAVHFGSLYLAKPSESPFWANLWYRVWINGGFGVPMFFVVSGFVITRLIAAQPGGLFKPDFREFYARRVGRILPLLIFICILGLVFIVLFPSPHLDFQYIFQDSHHPLNPSFWVSVATFSFNWHLIFSEPLHYKHDYGLYWRVLWSLAIEEQFYFFYPFLLNRLANERNLTIFLVITIIFGPVSTAVCYHFLPNYPAIGQNSFSGFGLIAIGCLLYLTSTRYKEYLSKDKGKCVQICLFGLLLFLIIYLHHYASVNYWFFFWAPNFMGYLIPPILAFGVFFFLLGALYLDFFNSRHELVISWIGKLSYGGYLYHSLTLYLLWPFLTGKNEWFGFFIFVTVTFGLAELSYRYFEVPVNLWIRKILGHDK